MLRKTLVALTILTLPACGEIKASDPPKPPQLTAAQLADAMVADYPGLKITEKDAQDHFEQLEARLLKDTEWPAVGGDCMKRLSPGGFVRVLGDAGTQAPAALRVWGTGPNDIWFLQFLVALPDGGARTAVHSPLPEKCRKFRAEDPDTVRYTVTERSSPLGDRGRLLDLEGVVGQHNIRGASTVLFAYKGVLAIIVCPLIEPGTFPERALKRLQEAL